jgi:addiction module HigA family antidote
MSTWKELRKELDINEEDERMIKTMVDDLKKGLEEAIDYERGTGDARRTTFPGTVFLEDVMKPLRLTVTDAAEILGVSENTISKFIDEKVAISQEMAIRISEAIGTSVERLMNMQKKDEQTKDLNT